MKGKRSEAREGKGREKTDATERIEAREMTEGKGGGWKGKKGKLDREFYGALAEFPFRIEIEKVATDDWKREDSEVNLADQDL